jgi:RNA polymerase sigma factor (sigma-70 family)
MKEDKYIWEEYRNGEEHALSYIYYQNIDFLIFFGKRFTKDENLIIDCVQDLFYELIRKRRNLGETDNIRLYLLKSLRRKLVREIQKKHKQEKQISELEIFPNIVFSVEEDLIEEEEKTQKKVILKKAMGELNDKQREILYYRFNCGFNYRQISEIMSITNDSARQLVSRAVSSLKNYLDDCSSILLFIFKKLKKINTI